MSTVIDTYLYKCLCYIMCVLLLTCDVICVIVKVDKRERLCVSASESENGYTCEMGKLGLEVCN